MIKTATSGSPRPHTLQGGVTLELQSVHFITGAAIWLQDPGSAIALTLVGCKFSAATISAPRVAVVGPKSKLTVINTTFVGAVNTAADSWATSPTGKGYGGAIMVDGAALTVSGSTFKGCKAQAGGAIAARANSPTTVVIEGSTFTGCATATTNAAFSTSNIGMGGAIFTAGFSKTKLSIKASAFDGCSANQLDLSAPYGASGGAIAVAPGDELSVTGSQFTLNKAELSGGAIATYGAGTRVSIMGSTFKNNQLEQGKTALVMGGTALLFGDTEQATVQDCSFLWSTEAYPVAMVFALTSTAVTTFDRCTWDGGVVAPAPPADTSASVGGMGALYMYGGMVQTTITR
jgi:hypothetical protein